MEMEFCLECQNFQAKKNFVNHLKLEHGFKTKKQYTEKWNKKAEESVTENQPTKAVKSETIGDQFVNSSEQSLTLTQEEMTKYFDLNNTLNSFRMELGRLYQILNGVVLKSNEVEEQFVEFKRLITKEKGLDDLAWFVDANTGEIKRQQ